MTKRRAISTAATDKRKSNEKIPLDRAKDLAQKLSTEDLVRLFEALVELPDSPIKPVPRPRLVSRTRAVVFPLSSPGKKLDRF